MLETDSLVGDDDYTSLAGFLLARFETLPEAGQSVEVDGLRYEILEVANRRIARVAIQRLAVQRLATQPQPQPE